MVSTIDGYGEWLKEEENIAIAKNRDEMNTMIDERKKTLRTLTVYNGFQETTGFSGTDLVGNDCNYRSNMFSSLQYDDLKQAYTESVVPVSIEDYEKREKFQSVEEMKRTRLNDETIRMNDCDPFATKRREDAEDDASRAFQLAKRDEEMRIIRSNMASNFLRIVN